MQQTHPPAIEEMHAESAAAKELRSQWDQLEVRNGLVYRGGPRNMKRMTFCNY